MGVVVEFAGPSTFHAATAPSTCRVGLHMFGEKATAPEPDGRFHLIFKAGSGHKWTINGKSYPHTDPLIVKANLRYRLVFDNQSAEAHPCIFTATRSRSRVSTKRPTSGVLKDVIVVPPCTRSIGPFCC